MAEEIELGEALETYVAGLVRTGRYDSASDVLRHGVQLVQQREADREKLFAALEEGFEDIRSRRTKPADEVFDRLEAKYRAMIDAENPGDDQ